MHMQKHYITMTEEERSVQINISATVGIMYYNGEIDTERLSWPDFEGRVLPEMVRQFLEIHEPFSDTYEEDILRFAQDALAPVYKGGNNDERKTTRIQER
ncbi:hypothetical protein C8J48_3759 [Desmospora activa DSM 45169]|uniref:Uncharacterized protein n=2 Tax=Desmospora TaxID=500614 RepID=A0A2T4YYV7_9BACL|nr:hypothetical protein C8J48_3759 [Desmospora activa DSM 45169]